MMTRVGLPFDQPQEQQMSKGCVREINKMTFLCALRGARLALFAALAVILAAPEVQALTDTFWTGASSDDGSNSGNWTGGVPDATKRARFNGDTGHAVNGRGCRITANSVWGGIRIDIG